MAKWIKRMKEEKASLKALEAEVDEMARQVEQARKVKARMSQASATLNSGFQPPQYGRIKMPAYGEKEDTSTPKVITDDNWQKVVRLNGRNHPYSEAIGLQFADPQGHPLAVLMGADAVRELNDMATAMNMPERLERIRRYLVVLAFKECIEEAYASPKDYIFQYHDPRLGRCYDFISTIALALYAGEHGLNLRKEEMDYSKIKRAVFSWLIEKNLLTYKEEG